MRKAQSQHFSEELAGILRGKPVSSRSDLLTLSPWVDESSMMRVGGRLGNVPLPDATRHPVIMSRGGDVTRLLIEHYHSLLLHAATEHVLDQIRQHYWIPWARATVRKILAACNMCMRRRAMPQPPRMANLPKARFDSSHPFSSVGVDYFGPILT